MFMKCDIMNIIGGGKERPRSRENLSWNPKEPLGCTRWGKVVLGRAAGSARPRAVTRHHELGVAHRAVDAVKGG